MLIMIVKALDQFNEGDKFKSIIKKILPKLSVNILIKGGINKINLNRIENHMDTISSGIIDKKEYFLLIKLITYIKVSQLKKSPDKVS